jgi:predicted acylesterase/phospholipase RssA
MPDRPFRILAIDGGGIRGVIPSLILAEFERRAKLPTASMFDLIIGTSTGGIISLGLGIPGQDGRPRYSAQDLVSLYTTEGARIFSPWSAPPADPSLAESLLGKLRAGLHTAPAPAESGAWSWVHALLHPKYGSAGVEGALREKLGDVPLSAITATRVAACSFDLDTRSLRLFRNWVARTNPAVDFPTWQAARATSAAPIYFPPAQVTSVNGATTAHCVDGGVCVNDPGVVGLSEAIQILRDGGEAERPVLLVSVGTGAPPAKAIPWEGVKEAGILGWFYYGLLDVIFDGVGYATSEEMARLVPPGFAYRFEPPLTGPGYSADPAFDDYSPKNMAQLEAAAQYFITQNSQALDAIITRLTG